MYLRKQGKAQGNALSGMNTNNFNPCKGDTIRYAHPFRTMKTGLLQVRPIYVRKAKRTRGHVFITSLSYMIIHEIKRLLPKLKDIPVTEIIDDLTAINLVELEDRNGSFYRVPASNEETQALLDRLGISIPNLIPKKGLKML